MEKLKVQTIYPSFMGEVNKFGIGTRCTFIRLAGCNIRCYKKTLGKLCDTPEALERSSGEDLSVGEIISKVKELPNPYKVICLTGGEPLLQDCHELLNELQKEGYAIVVETNGTVDISPYASLSNVSFVVDYKSSSSGENEKMISSNWDIMKYGDFLKFVLYDWNDFNQMLTWVAHHPYFVGQISAGLFWGARISYQELFDTLFPLDTPVHINVQAHKLTTVYDHFKESVSQIIVRKDL